MSPGLSEYMNSIGQGAMASPQGVIESFSSPLIFEPGSSWQYSTGLDWTGLLISRLSKTNLETFYQLNIFEPLGIEDITFWPDRKPELSARKATVSIRDPKVLDGSGKVIPFKGLSYVTGGKEELGGQGAYASMPSYLKILHSLLADDEKLLKKETTATMFEPQLTEKSQEVLQNIYKNKPMKGPCSIGNFPSDVKYDWGFGGLLTMQDINTDGVEWRRKGTLNWSGMLNLYWVGKITKTWRQITKLISNYLSTVYRQGG
jgi:CubicO group peptidase (beta-lactamase class C family)